MGRLKRRYRPRYFTQTSNKIRQAALAAWFDVCDPDSRIFAERIKVYRGISSYDETEVRTECENR